MQQFSDLQGAPGAQHWPALQDLAQALIKRIGLALKRGLENF